MDDGRTPDHGHPISSPCEPNGSGELKSALLPYSAVNQLAIIYATASFSLCFLHMQKSYFLILHSNEQVSCNIFTFLKSASILAIAKHKIVEVSPFP